MKFSKGDVVILPANKEEGWVKERAIVTHGPDSKDCYIVKVKTKDEGDDGIREIPPGGMILEPSAAQVAHIVDELTLRGVNFTSKQLAAIAKLLRKLS